ncbi:hypothetical protein VTJ49DRAFT_1920 [Mycothermus thermophilus]|uniref:Mitochondrial thiamine pyrophosphate carrier 1 n=1 Tax=Humicola insolens TaxID=85995 RepID=A0ABR3VCE2_HUMIN
MPRTAADVSPAAVAPRREAAVCPTDDEARVPRKTAAKDKRSFDYVWRSGVAGGLAGCAAKTVVAPLDRVKILFQSNNPQFVKYTGSWAGVQAAIKEIYHQDGPLGLFRGHSATLLRIFPYAAIKFLAYEQIRAIVIPRKDKETPLRRLISGSMAGVTSVFFTYPLEVVRVRLAFETKKDGRHTFRSICKHIYNEGKYGKPTTTLGAATTTASAGIPASTSGPPVRGARAFGLANFYRGFAPTILGMLPYAGMSFLTHDTAGDLLRHPSIARYTTLPKPANAPPGKAAPLRSWAELFAGGIAGLVSQTASYPLEHIFTPTAMDPNAKPKAEQPNSQQQQPPQAAEQLDNKAILVPDLALIPAPPLNHTKNTAASSPSAPAPISKPRHHGPANHNQYISDPLAHFLAIPWTTALLKDPAVLAIEVTDRRPHPDGRERLMKRVMNSVGTVRACVTFVSVSSGRKGGEDPKRGSLLFHVLLDLGEDLCGYQGVMHGGAIMLMLDEAMCSAANNQSEAAIGVTATMKTKFHKAIKLPAIVLVRVRVIKREGRKILVKGWVENSNGELHAEAEAMLVDQTLRRRVKL